MADEARWMWEAFITAPENEHLLKRYTKAAKEPAPLFDSIGEDLASSNQEVRERAYWVLVYAMPKLTSILHERETRQPGWRDVEGKDQKMINRGVDIVSYLHRKLVVENRFKIRGGRGKDPRPLMNKIARNWQEDEQRKSRREAPLDDEDALEIPDSAPSLEDSVLEKIAYEERKRELRNWGFYSNEDELALLETVYVDETTFAEVAKSSGITSEEALRKLAAALRQQASRSRQQAVAERDAMFTVFLLISEVLYSDSINAPPQTFETYERLMKWSGRITRSVRPRAWLNGVAANGMNGIAVCPLTTGFSGAPAYIYLMAIHKDSECIVDHLKTEQFPKELVDRFVRDAGYEYMHLPGADQLIKPTGKLIKPRGKRLWGMRYFARRVYHDVYPANLPGLKEAVDEVRDYYNTWLISLSLPTRSLKNGLPP